MATSNLTKQASAESYIICSFSPRVLRDLEERLGLMDPPERRASSEYRGFRDIRALLERRATRVHPASSDGPEIKENGATLA